MCVCVCVSCLTLCSSSGLVTHPPPPSKVLFARLPGTSNPNTHSATGPAGLGPALGLPCCDAHANTALDFNSAREPGSHADPPPDSLLALALFVTLFVFVVVVMAFVVCCWRGKGGFVVCVGVFADDRLSWLGWRGRESELGWREWRAAGVGPVSTR